MIRQVEKVTAGCLAEVRQQGTRDRLSPVDESTDLAH